MHNRSHPKPIRALIGATMAAALLIAAPASADPVVDTAVSSGIAGEQTDGYIGFRTEAGVDSDLRARVEQINIRRRQVYTQRASERGVSVNEMAAAVACEIYAARIEVGEYYRDESGQWRQHTASAPVTKPSFCP